MKTPNRINSLELICDCTQVTQAKHESLMEGSTKANGSKIREYIKTYLPDLYAGLCLDFYNPYEHKSRKKKGLFIYVHSGIEYFLKYD